MRARSSLRRRAASSSAGRGFPPPPPPPPAPPRPAPAPLPPAVRELGCVGGGGGQGTDGGVLADRRGGEQGPPAQPLAVAEPGLAEEALHGPPRLREVLRGERFPGQPLEERLAAAGRGPG